VRNYILRDKATNIMIVFAVPANTYSLLPTSFVGFSPLLPSDPSEKDDLSILQQVICEILRQVLCEKE
jgi:hypothetical protein